MSSSITIFPLKYHMLLSQIPRPSFPCHSIRSRNFPLGAILSETLFLSTELGWMIPTSSHFQRHTQFTKRESIGSPLTLTWDSATVEDIPYTRCAVRPYDAHPASRAQFAAKRGFIVCDILIRVSLSGSEKWSIRRYFL